jgi:pimeloyl-ACP methyl ester carboxylesterase
VLLVWAADDKFFPVEHARRLAGILPNARLELIEGSRTWVMRDRPERTADLIGRFARQTGTTPPPTWPEPTASLQGGEQHA